MFSESQIEQKCFKSVCFKKQTQSKIIEVRMYMQAHFNVEGYIFYTTSIK